MNKFTIVRDNTRHVKRFNFTGRSVDFKIKSIPENESPAKWIKDAVNQIFTYATLFTLPDDFVGVNFCSKDFNKGDGWLSFRKASKVSTDDLWNLIGSIYQSNGAAFDTETFCLSITTVRVPKGKGRGRNYNTFKQECSKRTGIITVNNTDNLCLPRALVVSIAHRIRSPFLKQVRQNIGKRQDIEAQRLMLDACVSIPEEGAGIEQLQQFQRHLTGFNIIVFAYGSKGRDLIFNGENSEAKHNLYLLHKDYHYNVITSLTSAFCSNYYCDTCFKPYNDKTKHRCTKACPCCKKIPACERLGKEILCEKCNRKFRNQDCLKKHELKSKSGLSLCEELKRCEDCLKTVATSRKHVCGEVYCGVCRNYKPDGHYCCIQPDTSIPKTDGQLFVFYDLETRQEKPLESTTSTLHEVNLCVFQYKCSKCLDKETCDICHGGMKVLRKEPIKLFMEFVLGIRKAFRQVIILAHNGASFDHIFILKYILDNIDLKPQLIMKGHKIVLLEFQNVRFLDSLNYFPMALSELTKAFDLGSGLNKGFYPFLFNTLSNECYRGPLPDMKFYDPDNMKADRRTRFLEWYEEHKNDTFDMQKELVNYCISDVDILTKACLKFRKMMIQETNVCPFSESVTIASSCHKVYRRNFLKPDTIGIVPRGGYRYKNNQSKIAIQWLLWVEKERGIDITHSAKRQEVRVDGVLVDGYYKDEEKGKELLFFFHGCYHHGHTCLTTKRDAALHEDPLDTLNARYERTLKMTERLRERGYDVLEMYECDFRRQMAKNKDIVSYTENHPLIAYTPLNPRDSFYGGRTGNTKTYYKCKPGEKIKYVDVCSLYPWVCKYGKFPLRHPNAVLVGEECNEENLSEIDGLIKCKVLPPRQLYHPVLPMKINNKLLFGLCRTCMRDLNQDECTHEEADRALTGTWTIPELQKALEKGYRLLETLEIWKYSIEQYDKLKKTGGLFTAMINKFMKIKQQSSGWPEECTSKEQRMEYIDQFLDQEDVKLEFEEVLENKGLRQMAKLILNSFWGKFGQRENLPKTCIIDEPHELYGLLTNPSVEVQSLQEIDEKKIIVSWNFKEEATDILKFTSVPIACYVTAQARLKLYSYLEKLDDRVLYYDTGM